MLAHIRVNTLLLNLWYAFGIWSAVVRASFAGGVTDRGWVPGGG
jgi:hypothetical protein